jgi:hypothetical protein
MTIQRLDSWKQIAAYFNRDQRTVQRWEIQRGLPVHRIPGGLKSAVYAFPNEIEAWLRGELPPSMPETAASTGRRFQPSSSANIGLLRSAI